MYEGDCNYSQDDISVFYQQKSHLVIYLCHKQGEVERSIYYESIKREIKRRLIYEYRCDEN